MDGKSSFLPFSCRYSDFLPRSNGIHVRLNSDSKLALENNILCNVKNVVCILNASIQLIQGHGRKVPYKWISALASDINHQSVICSYAAIIQQCFNVPMSNHYISASLLSASPLFIKDYHSRKLCIFDLTVFHQMSFLRGNPLLLVRQMCKLLHHEAII